MVVSDRIKKIPDSLCAQWSPRTCPLDIGIWRLSEYGGNQAYRSFETTQVPLAMLPSHFPSTQYPNVSVKHSSCLIHVIYVSEKYAQLLGSSPPPPPIANIRGPLPLSFANGSGFQRINLSFPSPPLPFASLFPTLLLALLTFSTILPKGSLNPNTQTFCKP